MPKLIRIAMGVLAILVVIETVYAPSRSFLPLGGDRLIQIGVISLLTVACLQFVSVYGDVKNARKE